MNKERLLKLEKHLRRGKLFHEKFDFSRYNSSFENKCGTSGCAVGELVGLFPKLWKWDEYGTPKLKTSNTFFTSPDVRKFFEIGFEEYGHLFEPKQQQPRLFGGKKLGKRATAIQVADNIKAFIEKMS